MDEPGALNEGSYEKQELVRSTQVCAGAASQGFRLGSRSRRYPTAHQWPTTMETGLPRKAGPHSANPTRAVRCALLPQLQQAFRFPEARPPVAEISSPYSLHGIHGPPRGQHLPRHLAYRQAIRDRRSIGAWSPAKPKPGTPGISGRSLTSSPNPNSGSTKSSATTVNPTANKKSPSSAKSPPRKPNKNPSPQESTENARHPVQARDPSSPAPSALLPIPPIPRNAVK